MFLDDGSAGSMGRAATGPVDSPAFDLAAVVSGLGRLVADAEVRTGDSEGLMADVVACEQARTLLDAYESVALAELDSRNA